MPRGPEPAPQLDKSGTLVNVQRKVQEVISGSVLLLLISCLCLVFSDNVHIKHIPNDEVNESLWLQSSGFALRFMDLINFFKWSQQLHPPAQ